MIPSNTEQGYILRRLIRRSIRLIKKHGFPDNILCDLVGVIIQQYKEVYDELGDNQNFIIEQIEKESILFRKTLDSGLKKAEQYFASMQKDELLSGELAFKLYGALRKVLGDVINQRGSNITEERLRFDFSFERKLTADELNEVSRIVNEAINKCIDVQC